MQQFLSIPAVAALLVLSAPAQAQPTHYTIDPKHTYVSLAIPHLSGISHWRGKFDHTQSGSVTLDPEAHSGSITVTIDTRSLNFGFPPMNRKAIGDDVLDTAKYPTAVFKADTIKYDGDKPVEADGQLTLHGVTKPLVLKLTSFKCIKDPFLKVERCGTDAYAEFDRQDFGIDYGVKLEGGGDVKLEIQVEGIKTPAPATS